MDKVLGSYYIDMRPAIVHYEENLYGGGFDSRGVPMCLGPRGPFYFPINIAQYGFMLHADWRETGSQETLKTLEACVEVLEEIKTEDAEHCVWWHQNRQVKYAIDPPWASAMAQGEIISLYLRMYQGIGRDSLLESAIKAYQFMLLEYERGGVRRWDAAGRLWLEEYPSQEPSYVLNGFIYAVFGLYDLFRVTQDARVKTDIDACIQTLAAKLHEFDSGYWSNYDLQKRELVRYYYQKNVHVPQLAVLYRLTGMPVFKEYADRWMKQITPWNYLLVQVMYRVRPRMARLRKVLRG